MVIKRSNYDFLWLEIQFFYHIVNDSVRKPDMFTVIEKHIGHFFREHMRVRVSMHMDAAFLCRVEDCTYAGMRNTDAAKLFLFVTVIDQSAVKACYVETGLCKTVVRKMAPSPKRL